MPRWFEILDHQNDPGRYTLIEGSAGSPGGRIVTANENGSVVCVRRCHNPYTIVGTITREDRVRTAKPSQQPDILKKIYRFLNEDLDE